jgi:Flp pilus assembly protein TadG
MRPLQSTPELRSRRSVRGVAFIYFTGLALPILFFAAAFAVDFTRIIIVTRNMENAAAAAAAASSWQLVPGKVAIDETAAKDVGTETLCASTKYIAGAAAAGKSKRACGDGREVDADILFSKYATQVAGYPSGGPTTVTVRTEFKVTNMIFFFYFNGERTATSAVSQSASVCVPGDTAGFTGGNCTRPR